MIRVTARDRKSDFYKELKSVTVINQPIKLLSKIYFNSHNTEFRRSHFESEFINVYLTLKMKGNNKLF